jgi:hypothetical protein
VRKYFTDRPGGGRFETAAERERSIRGDLLRSKQELESRLPGKTVFAFAFPFNESGPTVERLLAETGFRLAFGGIGDRRPLSGSLSVLRRTSGDFVRRLPGRGRKSMTRLLIEKTVRRLHAGPGY